MDYWLRYADKKIHIKHFVISLPSPYSPIAIVLVMWHNTVQSSVYFRRVQSKIRSGCTLEVPNEIRDSKPLIQLMGHPKATMRYAPHFLARNERHKQKEICLPNSVIMSHSRFLLFDVTILIVCVLWSRTLKKVKVQNRIESTVGKKDKENRRQAYDTYAIIFDECIHLGWTREK